LKHRIAFLTGSDSHHWLILAFIVPLVLHLPWATVPNAAASPYAAVGPYVHTGSMRLLPVGGDPALLYQIRRVTRILPPATCRAAGPAVKELLSQMESSAPPANLLSAARRIVNRYFRDLPQEKEDALVFYVLSVDLIRLDLKAAYIRKYIEQHRQTRNTYPAIPFSEVLSDVESIYGNVGDKTIEGCKAAQDMLKADLDRMNKLSEQTSLRLQMTMDRRSKFIETLSVLMKKISTTRDTLIQNIK